MSELRDRILKAATALFACKGYGATSMREVVDVVGVSKPTLYYWFRNKDCLFIEAVNAQIQRLDELRRAALDVPGDPFDRLRRFLRSYLDASLSDRDGVLLMLTVQHPSTADQPPVDIMSVNRDTVIGVAEVLGEARTSGLVRSDFDVLLGAVSLLGAANLYIIATLHGLPEVASPHEQLFDGFLRGAMAPARVAAEDLSGQERKQVSE